MIGKEQGMGTIPRNSKIIRNREIGRLAGCNLTRYRFEMGASTRQTL